MSSNKNQVRKVLLKAGFRTMSIRDNLRLYKNYFSLHWKVHTLSPLGFYLVTVFFRILQEGTDDRNVIFGSLTEFIVLSSIILVLAILFLFFQARKSLDSVGKLLILPSVDPENITKESTSSQHQKLTSQENTPTQRPAEDAINGTKFKEALVVKVSNVPDGVHVRVVKNSSNLASTSEESTLLKSLSENFISCLLPVDLFASDGSLFNPDVDSTSRDEPDPKEIRTIRPKVFEWPPIILWVFLVISVIMAAQFCIAFFLPLATGQDSTLSLSQFIPIIVSFTACIWISVIGLLVFRYERQAWFLFGKFTEYVHLYFEATKDFKDYAISNLFGIIAIIMLFATNILLNHYSTDDDLDTRWIIKLISGLLVFLAITSTGKVFGSGTHSLVKAIVERNRLQEMNKESRETTNDK